MKDGCEWNPKENRPTYMGEESHAQAEIILGDGTWRVCKECSKLPIFANVHYKVTPITHKETMNEYRIATEAEKEEADVYEDYELLIGPNNFQCALTEPEDRTFHRDLKPIIEELNRLWNLNLFKMREHNVDSNTMEEEIKQAFNEYLGVPFEDMDRIGQSIYSLDYYVFRAGFLTAVHSYPNLADRPGAIGDER